MRKQSRNLLSPAKNIILFFLLSGLIFGLLVIPWPGPVAGPAPYLMDGYRWGFRTAGNVVFAQLGQGGSARFEPLSTATHEQDTTVRLRNRLRDTSGSMDIKILNRGYRPTAFTLALILATPIPWRRRLVALLVGFAAVSLFVMLRTWIQLVDVFSEGNVLAAYELGRATKTTLKALVGVFVRSPAVAYIVPVIIWMLVAQRREDWARFGMRVEAPPLQHKTAARR